MHLDVNWSSVTTSLQGKLDSPVSLSRFREAVLSGPKIKIGLDLPVSNTVKHTQKIKSYSQAFNFRKKAEKKPGELYEDGGQIRCKQKMMW